MRVTVDIPDHEWATLVNRAEAHNLKVQDLILAGITSVMPNTLPIRHQIILMVKAGYPDKIIAARFEMTNQAVQKIRLAEKLPANPWRKYEAKRKTAA